MGEHAEMAPVNNDLQASQIASPCPIQGGRDGRARRDGAGQQRPSSEPDCQSLPNSRRPRWESTQRWRRSTTTFKRARLPVLAQFKAAEMGEHAEMAPVNNDLQASQIASPCPIQGGRDG